MKKDRIANIAKYWLDNGTPRPELRGGARNLMVQTRRRRAVRDHIMQFNCRASRARRGAPGRKYLPSDMSVKTNVQIVP